MDKKHKFLNETKIGVLSVLQNTELLQDQDSKSNVKATRAPLESKLSKLSFNMKNISGPQINNEDFINRSSYHRLLEGNPECQIKVLEKNLKFLFQEHSAYNYVQIKSNLLSLETRLTNSELASENNVVNPNLTLNNEAEPNSHYTQEFNFIPAKTCNNEDLTETVSYNCLKEKRHFFRQDLGLGKINTLSKNMTTDNKNSNRLMCSATQLCQVKPLCSSFKRSSEEQVDIKKDIDNQFEFTVEEEKIVSFICSPPTKKNNEPCIDTEGSEDQLISDQDSDKYSEMWADCNGEIDSLSEGVCSNSSIGNKTIDSECISRLKVLKPTYQSSKLLWHPPHSFSSSLSSISRATPLLSNGVFTKLPTVSEANFNDISNNIKVHKTMASSLSRETTLFRETALRGCYNMEQIVQDLGQSQVHVQQELKMVKGSIFSAVKVHAKNEDLVSNSILSILDIFKSWLKLSSLFKDTELADILETNVGDMSIFNDFLQWQCMSRVFIDKMIDTLQNITQHKKDNIKAGHHLKNTDNLWFKKNANNAEKSCSFSIRQNSPNFNNTLKVSILPTPECEVSLNKNWKQRRFTLEQPKSSVKDSNKNFASLSSLQSKAYNNGCSKKHNPSNISLFFGQGDVPPVNYNNNSYFEKINHPYPNNSSPLGQGDVKIPSNNSHSCFHSGGLSSYQIDKLTNFPGTSKCSKQFNSVDCDTNTYFYSAARNVTNDLSTISLPIDGNNSVVNSNFSVLPPFPNTPTCYTNANNNYQFNSCQFTVKQNPIQCTDSDVIERCTKSSYMKPGSYNIPEKPLGFQKVVNNNIPIEDSPVVGVPFLFSGSQSNIPSPKAVSAISLPKKGELTEELINFSEEKWKAALSSAETFRDNLMGDKADGTQNFMISDSELFETHFLLPDDVSHGSSSDVSKYNSESEDLSHFNQLNSTTGLSIVDKQSKTSDWLITSFNKAVSVKEKESFSNTSNDKAKMFDGKNFGSAELSKISFIDETFDITDKHVTQNDIQCSKSKSENNNVYCPNDKILKTDLKSNSLNAVAHKSDWHDSDLNGRKFIKNDRKNEDDLNMTSLFDHKSSLYRKKTKSIFKKTVTKQVLSKLQDILNCICNAEVSSLVEFDLKSDKEPSKLEMKVRCPLYLQAMRCKLANNSYDTLDQALADFHKYFMDIRNRNKGDKLCIEAIGSLEHLFLDLVEKHFGFAPFHHQCFALRDLASTVKPRKAKKNSRRC